MLYESTELKDGVRRQVAPLLPHYTDLGRRERWLIGSDDCHGHWPRSACTAVRFHHSYFAVNRRPTQQASHSSIEEARHGSGHNS